ncbi:DUF3291 domain-containing protein [Pseudomonas turukhanskensis]|uniref:DUF3291 domain-containing protein n=1 Tax=Pseudomonas turukhanskensis TaxID=1806536 RepID=A0A9W6NFL1_9PSED|nr:DUF3291 domain-containing protein [Pseudomonas turukhanskensis]GLK88947.1 hypothetical protein GCM10017655_20090 [Pseudomonas turukhanskensis]
MYHLAQVNIARTIAPLDDPLMRGFVEQLDPINQLAERSEGFVWRLQTEEGDATSIQLFADDRIIVNLSVWASFEALKNYVYSGDHLTVLKAKKSWMEKLDMPSLALWWLPVNELPTAQDAKRRLEHLAKNGPSSTVFTFARPYPAPHAQAGAADVQTALPLP